ncbi:septal ring lytic transglycosylase RlpA family protein [Dactylosporangium siamense]|uniref:septal ring lytic transglycosylase RlpA family protein n=1 Tax=Dactylosporangium siamense TaxID=685454 RepID=UPI001EF2DD3B|nr:septal ring lytic transglycosylase RlpA family protein [Dactylosporangium siamense]
MIAGVVAAIALIGGAVATVNMGSDDAEPTAASDLIDGSRSPADRADRGERPSSSASASVAPSPAASASASPQVSKVPEATKTPTRKPSTTRTPGATGGAVTSTGTCNASYYDTGSRTANGESFDPNGLTAAHKELPFNTRVRVTNLANGKSVVVRINDRGPFVSGRCLDLARGAFVTIASVSAGVINARYEVLK